MGISSMNQVMCVCFLRSCKFYHQMKSTSTDSSDGEDGEEERVLLVGGDKSLTSPPPMRTGKIECEACRKQFGWWWYPVNCKHCGGQFCTNCASEMMPIPKVCFHVPLACNHSILLWLQFGMLISKARVCKRCAEVIQVCAFPIAFNCA